MALPTKPLSEITEEAIHLLAKEMGAADTMRFLLQFTTGPGNYTEERHELFKDMTMDDILGEIRQRREERKS